MKSAISILATIIILCAGCTKPADETAPSNPTNFKAENIGGDVKLTWVAPPNQDTKEYSLTYLPDGVPRNIPKDSTSVLLTHFEVSNTYVFTLRTRNMAGNVSNGISVEITIVQDTLPSGNGNTGRSVYVGDLTFSSQEDIDKFNNGYTRIEGKVIISGVGITNLKPLSSIDSVNGLEIYFNDSLSALTGLNNIKYIGGTFYFRENKKILNVNELSQLLSIDKDLVVLDNKRLENLNGFSSLQTVDGSLYIGIEAWKDTPKARGNLALTDYCGLKGLLQNNGLKGEFFIKNNLNNPTTEEILSGCN